MLKLISQACLCAALLLLSTNPATAAVIYELNLPANGNVDAIRVQVTVPTFVTSSLFVVDMNDPEITLFNSGSVPLPNHSVGLAALPSMTRIGFSLADASGNLATLNRDYPDDFFVFNRLPNEIGTFSSVAGNIEASAPYTLDTATPIAQLIVSGQPDDVFVPEPSSVLTTGAGMLLLGTIIRRKLRTF